MKTTKPITIYAGERKEIHGLTKIKHGGYSVNCMSEPGIGHSLPTGFKLQAGYSQLSPGSCRVSTVIDNLSDKDITIPAKSIISQLSLANKIPKLVYPGDDRDIESEEMDDKDEGLTFQQFQQHKVMSEELNLGPEVPEIGNQHNKVEVEDLGADLEEDLGNLNQINSNPQYSKSQTKSSEEPNNPNSEEEDDGSWILKLIDLSGLEDWPEHLQTEAKEMLKRNAKTLSKNDLDMGRTNLVKHHIKLTDPLPFKEAYSRIPPQMYDEVRVHIQEILDLGAIRPSNSPWASAIVLVRKKDGRLRFCIESKDIFHT